jgi:hypothetical protein
MGCVGVILALLLLWLLVYLVIKAIPYLFHLVQILLLIGVLFGIAITIRNYALALYYNIKPEKVTP